MAGLPNLGSGDLQTLLSTLQQTNQQLGQIVKALATTQQLSNQTLAQISGFTTDAAAAAGGVPLWGIYINIGTTPYTLAVRHV
jgi:hypothetical protein